MPMTVTTWILGFVADLKTGGYYHWYNYPFPSLYPKGILSQTIDVNLTALETQFTTRDLGCGE